MVRVQSPVRTYTGISAGVAFANGVGECDKESTLKWFREHGYIVADDQMSEDPAKKTISKK